MSWSKKELTLEVPSEEQCAHRRTVRRIVTEFELQPSSRILVVGDTPQHSLEYLEFLGIDVVSENEATEFSPTLEQTIPLQSHEEKVFDAVIVFFDNTSPDPVFNQATLQSTASRLRILRPDGHFAFALDFPARVEAAHREECFIRHLSCFPGKISHGRSETNWLSLKKLENPQYSFLSLQVPDAASYPQSWSEFVKPSLKILPQRCCEFAFTSSSIDWEWKRAA